jgi:hypothetical protein
LRAVIPATSAGSYSLAVVDGTAAAYYASLNTSTFPTWTTSAYNSYSLTVSVQLVATGDSALTYSLYSGSLPSGLSLSSSGVISGTTTAISTSFTVSATDAQTHIGKMLFLVCMVLKTVLRIQAPTILFQLL